MAMTEAEAKTKWCPNARAAVYAGGGSAAVNRYPDPNTIEDLCQCIGSRCMFWRWDHGSSVVARMPGLLNSEKAAKIEAGKDPANLRPTEGHCGQAGAD